MVDCLSQRLHSAVLARVGNLSIVPEDGRQADVLVRIHRGPPQLRRGTDTVTECPYKGVTSDYWSLQVDGRTPKEYEDVAWSYQFPTRQLLPIAGLVAFYDEKVDMQVDGVLLPRPHSRSV